jgi:hypothetical protein
MFLSAKFMSSLTAFERIDDDPDPDPDDGRLEGEQAREEEGEAGGGGEGGGGGESDADANPDAESEAAATPTQCAPARLSDPLRGGVKMMVALGLAAVLAVHPALVRRFPHGVWVPATVGFVMSENRGMSFATSVNRFIGSTAGSIAASYILELADGRCAPARAPPLSLGPDGSSGVPFPSSPSTRPPLVLPSSSPRPPLVLHSSSPRPYVHHHPPPPAATAAPWR